MKPEEIERITELATEVAQIQQRIKYSFADKNTWDDTKTMVEFELLKTELDIALGKLAAARTAIVHANIDNARPKSHGLDVTPPHIDS